MTLLSSGIRVCDSKPLQHTSLPAGRLKLSTWTSPKAGTRLIVTYHDVRAAKVRCKSIMQNYPTTTRQGHLYNREQNAYAAMHVESYQGTLTNDDNLICNSHSRLSELDIPHHWEVATKWIRMRAG
eukprot:5574022-Amphidinium_carterae.1